MPVQTVIQLRTSAAATWTSVNPTLALGEVGFESDTNKLKIGDGTTAWATLDYAAGAGGAVVSATAPTTDLFEGMMWFNSTEAKTYIYYSSAWVELSPAIAGPTGPEGPTGPSGVIAVTSPITNSGTSTSATIGINQSLLAITQSQVTDLTTALAAKASLTGAETLTNKTLANPSFTGSAQELVTIVATGFAGYTYNAATQAVVYITANSTANGTVNVRGDGATTLNTFMAVGEAVTVVLAVTNGATAYYPTAYQIDGVAVTPKWVGTAPAAGNASAIDSYTLTIIKTAATPTYTVLASQTKFA